MLNGFEVRSIAHEKARQLLFTGDPGAADDWESILAAAAVDDHPMPFAVLAGPTFSRDLASEVVRFGTAGQLGVLLDGTALDGSDPSPPRSLSAEAAIEAAVTARVEAAEAAAGRGRERLWTSGYATSMDRVERIHAARDQVSFSTDNDFSTQLASAVTCLELGLSRVCLVENDGYQHVTWDSHANNSQQSIHFEDLFAALNRVLADMRGRTGPAGGALLDEVTVVVLSELGRHPRLNGFDGKDHWTYTSAMLLGSGIQGGRTIGGWDADVFGRRVDLPSGDVTDSGEALTSKHLGATLLALGDVDPGPYCDGAEPILGMYT